MTGCRVNSITKPYIQTFIMLPNKLTVINHASYILQKSFSISSHNEKWKLYYVIGYKRGNWIEFINNSKAFTAQFVDGWHGDNLEIPLTPLHKLVESSMYWKRRLHCWVSLGLTVSVLLIAESVDKCLLAWGSAAPSHEWQLVFYFTFQREGRYLTLNSRPICSLHLKRSPENEYEDHIIRNSLCIFTSQYVGNMTYYY